jgi:hypothetical protein
MKQACPAIVGASTAAAAAAVAAQTAPLTAWCLSVWAWQAQLHRQLLQLMLCLQLLLMKAVTSCSSCLKGAASPLPAVDMQAAPVVPSSWQQLTYGRCCCAGDRLGRRQASVLQCLAPAHHMEVSNCAEGSLC